MLDAIFEKMDIMKKYIITLTKEERDALRDVISMRKIDRVKKRFVMGSMEAVLNKKKGNPYL
jgi:hypothetical protein